MTMNKQLLGCLILTTLGAQAAVNFTANYTDSTGFGFDDATLGADRKTAFEHALTIMESYFGESYMGQEIVVDAMFANLGGSATSATLGFAGSTTAHLVSGEIVGASLGSNLTLSDINGATSEIQITFNADVDGPVVFGASGFYYGTDAMPGSESDFVTTALHEISHGLGISSQIQSDGTFLNDPFPARFDTFLYDAAVGGTALTALSDADRQAAITSGDLWWGGANAVAANGGNRVQMYAPSPYEPGSSVSHLDEATYSTLTLGPSLSGNLITHEFDPIELGLFADLGWATIPEPSSVLLLGFSAIALLRRRR